MTSNKHGAGGSDLQDGLQDAKTTSARLTGSPKLRFDRVAGGDTITRNEGNWDSEDGFAIGQRITISGALNAGDFTITNIVNDGKTLVLDTTNTVIEISTKALSISEAVDAPAEQAAEQAADESPDRIDAHAPDADAPAAESPQQNADSRDLAWLFEDSPAEDLPAAKSSNEESPNKDAQPEASPLADWHPGNDDVPEAGGPLTDALATTSPTAGDDGVEAKRRATHAPGRAIRSRAEVETLLLALCEEQLTVTAYPGDGEMLFAARVRAVDFDLSRIILDYGQWKPANSALLDCKQTLFHCERKNRHVQFMSGAPSEVVYGGNAGIQVGFPKFILDLQQRTDRRFRLATRPSMWCVITQEGSDPIVAKVDDISRGGLGGIAHDPAAALKPGMIFKNCQITGAELKQPIDVSVEIRYLKTVRSPEGLLSKRVGCRFVAPSADLQQLIDVFIVDLDDDAPNT
jgi:c-di-GMP-binding flagellar brake protein YcgR